ncbi:MAG: hypothetical protein LBQ16_01705, partial [Gracilibacteraceae bacterium]|nr:hypothetical protein [Gracilibacteraceae bacterium]
MLKKATKHIAIILSLVLAFTMSVPLGAPQPALAAFTPSISYAYDLAGRITESGTPYGLTAYAYDALGRLALVTDDDGAETAFGYDENGNLAWIAYPTGVTAAYTYNANNALTGETLTDSAAQIIESYTYTVGFAG